MAKVKFEGSYKGDKYVIKVGLSLYLWKEDGTHFIYSPALDLTGYGESETAAKESFDITLEEFLKYTNNKKTIFDELEKLGWTVNRKKRRIHAPDKEDLFMDNEVLKEIVNKTGVREESESVELSLS